MNAKRRGMDGNDGNDQLTGAFYVGNGWEWGLLG